MAVDLLEVFVFSSFVKCECNVPHGYLVSFSRRPLVITPNLTARITETVAFLKVDFLKIEHLGLGPMHPRASPVDNISFANATA